MHCINMYIDMQPFARKEPMSVTVQLLRSFVLLAMDKDEGRRWEWMVTLISVVGEAFLLHAWRMACV